MGVCNEIVLITGISSFHGGHIARELVKKGYDVHGLLRNVSNRSFEIDGVTMHKGDVCYAENINKIVVDSNADIVIHLAAQSSVEYSFTHPREAIEVNYLGTYNVANACLGLVDKFVMASSVEVYGNQPVVPLCEYMKPNPASPYGVAKTSAETYINYLSRGFGLPSVILRTANTYGRDRTDYFVVERIITSMLRGDKTIKLGIPDSIRDFLFVDDELSAYMKVIESDDPLIFGETFNTGTEVSTSIEKLFNTIKRKLHSDAMPQWYSNSLRPYEIHDLTANYEKINSYLGWSPRYDLNEGLDKTIKMWDTDTYDY